MYQRFRFSLRGLLFLTAAVAVVMTIAMSWLYVGMLSGPCLLLLSLLGSIALLFARHKPWGRFMHRCAVATFLFFVLLYASFGPATWAMARYNLAFANPLVSQAYSFVYVPIAINYISLPEPVRSAAVGFISWWMPGQVEFMDWGTGIGWSVPGRSYTIVSY